MVRPPAQSAAAYSAGRTRKVTATAPVSTCTGVYSIAIGSHTVCQGAAGKAAFVPSAVGNRGLTAEATVTTRSLPL